MKSDLYNQSEEDEDTECERIIEKQPQLKSNTQPKKNKNKTVNEEESIEDKLSIEKDQISGLPTLFCRDKI